MKTEGSDKVACSSTCSTLCYHTLDKVGDDFGFALLLMPHGIAQQAVHQTVGSDAYDTYAGSLGSALTTAALVDTYSGIEQSYAPTLAPARIVHSSGTQGMCAESTIGASFIFCTSSPDTESRPS